jgi:enolase-phosphatase E1
MIVFDGQAVLLDVEGTTSSIAFVYDVLFEYARREVGGFLAAHRLEADVMELAAACCAAAGRVVEPAAIALDPSEAANAAIDLMNRDLKLTPLKTLQGMIWRSGYESGSLRSHVFDDVPPALQRWSESGLDVRIYSSGSVEAQRLFFAHTTHGDLTGCLRGHYDTVTGPKRDPRSYGAIAADIGCEPRRILFASDVGEELDAAQAAGMATVLVRRPGNREPGGLLSHAEIQVFDEIVT